MLKKPSGYKSSIVSLVGLALPLLAFLFSTPHAIAYFGDEQFGLLLLLISIQALMLSVDFGLSSGAVVLMARHISKGDYSKASQVLSEVAVAFLLLAILMLISAYIIGMLLEGRTIFANDAGYVFSLIKVVTLGVFFALLGNALSLFLKALEQIPTVVLIQSIYTTGIWLCVYLVSVLEGDLIDILWFGIVLYIVQFCLYCIWLIRSPVYTFHPYFPTGAHLKGILGYSGFAFISQLTSMVTYHIDRILIGVLSSVSQVSYYAVPANIVSRLLNVGALFNGFVFPRAVSLHAEGNYESLCALYIKASRYTFLLLIPVLIPLVIFTPELLTIWLGEGFAENSQLTTRILLAAFFIATISITPSQIYNGMGNSRIGAVYSTIGSLVNVILCLVLIPQFGATGAALASLAAMLQAILYRNSLEKELGINRRKQGVLHLVMIVVALLQAGFCLLIHGFELISDIYSAFSALAVSWLLFYLCWLLLPARFSGQERALCGRVFARIR